MRQRTPIAARLLARLETDRATGCINWTGAKNPKGYGRIGEGRGSRLLTHRVAYELARGPIPEGLVIDHLCRNPACCNPDHMEAVTTAENTRRGRSGAKDAEKTHCPQGHPYDDANTYRAPQGDRHCRKCISLRRKRYPYRRSLRAPSSETQSSSPAEGRAGNLPPDEPS